MRLVKLFPCNNRTDGKQIPQEDTDDRWHCFRRIKPRTGNGGFEFPVGVKFYSVGEDEDSMGDEDSIDNSSSITLEISSEVGLAPLCTMRYDF